MHFDLLIRGGQLIDGTGAPARQGDVGIVGGRIAAVGHLSTQETRAAKVIQADRLVVAPGFIDVHTHSDGWLLKQANFLPKTSQGFTTEVLASDGISYAPVTEHNWRDWFLYLRALDALEPEDYREWRSLAEYIALFDRATAQNTAVLAPYANLRVLAAGWRRGPLDDSQRRIVRREVEKTMEAGAIGLSTGLDYIAECFATTGELVDACRAMASWKRPYVTHVRYKIGTLAGVQEAVEIGKRAGVPVHISHLKAGTAQLAEQILDYVDRVAINEVDFTFDIYPYLAGSTMLNYLLPYEVWEDGPSAAIDKLGDPGVRERFALALACYDLPPEQVRIAWIPGETGSKHVGKSLADFARDARRPLAEALADLLQRERLAGLSILEAADDRLVEPFLRHSKFMLGSDGIWFPDGQVHPRVYGSASRMLGPLVRDRKLFSLEEAVRRMTSVAAERFGLADRGLVREGAFADLVVFDPQRVGDRASYQDPHQLSVGIDHVVVGGVEVIAGGTPADDLGRELPGRALRYGG
jgi:N-acyl-D-amino-acid deacylase